ncbi:MAG: hypothetical protein KUG73_12765 [Pseudomonadales bacterium]|nr:hypothetical protein [Pseudomonadales bacterium]
MRTFITPSTTLYLRIIAATIALCATPLSMGQSEPLSFLIPQLEGAQHKPSYVLALTQWLEKKHCRVNINKHKLDSSKQSAHTPVPALLFNILPGRNITALPVNPGYRIIAKGDVIDNAPLSLQWLSLSQQNLSQISSLKNERLALLPPPNPIGNYVALNTLRAANVAVDPNKLFYTTSYQGSVALLLHRNVRAAAVISPLANRWKLSNDLRSLIETPVEFVAVIMIKHHISKRKSTPCIQAFNQLKRKNRRDPLMKLFPEWLTSFHSVNQY